MSYVVRSTCTFPIRNITPIHITKLNTMKRCIIPVTTFSISVIVYITYSSRTRDACKHYCAAINLSFLLVYYTRWDKYLPSMGYVLNKTKLHSIPFSIHRLQAYFIRYASTSLYGRVTCTCDVQQGSTVHLLPGG